MSYPLPRVPFKHRGKNKGDFRQFFAFARDTPFRLPGDLSFLPSLPRSNKGIFPSLEFLCRICPLVCLPHLLRCQVAVNLGGAESLVPDLFLNSGYRHFIQKAMHHVGVPQRMRSSFHSCPGRVSPQKLLDPPACQVKNSAFFSSFPASGKLSSR